MSDKNYFDKSIDELSVKEALTWDAGNILAKHTLIIDPAPLPTIPITPFVIGKKVIKGVKGIVNSIKSK